MNPIVVDTEHLEPLHQEIIQSTVQLFANLLVNGWTEIQEAEDGGKNAFSFGVTICGRSIDAKLTGSKKFKYDDQIFVKDPNQPDLFEGEEPEHEEINEEQDYTTLNTDTLPDKEPEQLEYKGWWTVLGFDSPQGLTESKIEKAYKKLAKQLHPDTEEGDHEKMQQLNAARTAALDYVERSKPRDIPEGETQPEETDSI
jgi:hypothetical protein